MRGKTLFVDIDGTILKHQGNATAALSTSSPLDKVVDYFNEWHSKGYRLVITTGRTESMREVTERQLRECGLFWDLLIMGLGAGERILINDQSKEGFPKAIAINVPRDAGFSDINQLYREAKQKCDAHESGDI